MAYPARIHRVALELSRALLLGAAASSMLLLVGCDGEVSKTDKAITEQLEDASTKLNGADPSAAHAELDSASRDATGSLPVRLQAKAMLADSELRTAEDLANKVQPNDAIISRLLREMGLLGDEIATNNRQIAALAKYEPTAVQSAISQKKAAVKGSDDKPDWVKAGDASLPSLSAEDKMATELQAKISQLQDTIKSEADQRNQLLNQADKLIEQSNREQQAKSVDLYVNGATLRKQAADTTVKLDQDNVELARAQADLAVHQGQHDALTNAIKSLDDKSAFYASEWASVQKQVASLNAKSQVILGEDPVTKPAKNPKTGDLLTEMTIGSKAAAVSVLAGTRGSSDTQSNAYLRGVAETHFNSAVQFYKESAELAQKLGADLGEKMSKNPDPMTNPDLQAYTDLKNAFDANHYRFLEANAELEKAEFFARSAAENKSRLGLLEQLKPVIAAAQLTMPATLEDGDGSMASGMKSSQDSARQSYQNAVDLLSKIAEGTGTAEQRNPAKVELIFAHYSWWALESEAGDAQKAAEQLTAAKTAVGDATAENASVPALPPELAEAKPASK